MALYIQFYKKGFNEPEKLAAVDNAICEHFDVIPDPKVWYNYWFDVVGFYLAASKSYSFIVGEFPEYQGICEFLENNYDINNWRG